MINAGFVSCRLHKGSMLHCALNGFRAKEKLVMYVLNVDRDCSGSLLANTSLFLLFPRIIYLFWHLLWDGHNDCPSAIVSPK